MDGKITDIELAGPVVLAEVNYHQTVVFAGSLTDIAHREISIGDRIRCYGRLDNLDTLIADGLHVLGPVDSYGDRRWKSHKLRETEMAELGIDRVSVDRRRLVACPELVI